MEKRKILIVDDDANIAELIALYLTKNVFNVKLQKMAKPLWEKHQSFSAGLNFTRHHAARY